MASVNSVKKTGIIAGQKLRNHQPLVLDLFAGAGGLSEGFIRAGAKMIGHIEMDTNACSTLVTRMMYHALREKGAFNDYKKYVRNEVSREQLILKHHLEKERDSVICAAIGKENIKQLIASMRNKLNGGQVDLIIGGPPCQAYSHIGRARDKNGMKRDKRNFLYRYYVEFLKAFQPKMFVFENVTGLISSAKGRHLREMRKLMRKAGYETDYKIINAAEYGVPQSRRRVILVGWNKKTSLSSYPTFAKKDIDFKVKELFQDLPRVKSGENRTLRTYKPKNTTLINLGISSPEFTELIDHVTRPHSKQDLEIYRLAVKKKNKGESIKYTDLPKRLKTHKKQDIFLDRFKVVDREANYAHTVVAHIGKDGHFYIHPDLEQNRSISVREAARLQTFPDDFKFEGARTSQFKQIGNAVPPMLSELIARTLIQYL